jgi:hypothetical protein
MYVPVEATDSSQNVGHCVDALFDDRRLHDDSKSLTKLQAVHVSIISLSSCMGRITAGTSSDILSRRYSLPPTWCLVCASLVLILAQLAGWTITDINTLVSTVLEYVPKLTVYCFQFNRLRIWFALWLCFCDRYAVIFFHPLIDSVETIPHRV